MHEFRKSSDNVTESGEIDKQTNYVVYICIIHHIPSNSTRQNLRIPLTTKVGNHDSYESSEIVRETLHIFHIHIPLYKESECEFHQSALNLTQGTKDHYWLVY
jgi:hypothetical protein